MTCKNCIHEAVCSKLCPNGLLPYQSTDYPAEIFCLEFKNQEDVAPVIHGKWIDALYVEKYGDAYCSECNHFDWSNLNYCSRCGARMDGGSK